MAEAETLSRRRRVKRPETPEHREKRLRALAVSLADREHRAASDLAARTGHCHATGACDPAGGHRGRGETTGRPAARSSAWRPCLPRPNASVRPAPRSFWAQRSWPKRGAARTIRCSHLHRHPRSAPGSAPATALPFTSCWTCRSARLGPTPPPRPCPTSKRWRRRQRRVGRQGRSSPATSIRTMPISIRLRRPGPRVAAPSRAMKIAWPSPSRGWGRSAWRRSARWVSPTKQSLRRRGRGDGRPLPAAGGPRIEGVGANHGGRGRATKATNLAETSPLAARAATMRGSGSTGAVGRIRKTSVQREVRMSRCERVERRSGQAAAASRRPPATPARTDEARRPTASTVEPSRPRRAVEDREHHAGQTGVALVARLGIGHPGDGIAVLRGKRGGDCGVDC